MRLPSQQLPHAAAASAQRTAHQHSRAHAGSRQRRRRHSAQPRARPDYFDDADDLEDEFLESWEADELNSEAAEADADAADDDLQITAGTMPPQPPAAPPPPGGGGGWLGSLNPAVLAAAVAVPVLALLARFVLKRRAGGHKSDGKDGVRIAVAMCTCIVHCAHAERAAAPCTFARTQRHCRCAVLPLTSSFGRAEQAKLTAACVPAVGHASNVQCQTFSSRLPLRMCLHMARTGCGLRGSNTWPQACRTTNA